MSIKYSVICASVGLAMAALLVLWVFGWVFGAWDFFGEMFGSRQFREPIIVALGTLYAAALVLGLVTGDLIHRVGVPDPRVWFIGIGLAWSCLSLAVLAGSSVNFFNEMHNEPSVADAFEDWVFKPVFWVLLLGVVPALGLGLVYAAGVRKALRQ